MDKIRAMQKEAEGKDKEIKDVSSSPEKKSLDCGGNRADADNAAQVEDAGHAGNSSLGSKRKDYERDEPCPVGSAEEEKADRSRSVKPSRFKTPTSGQQSDAATEYLRQVFSHLHLI